MQMELMAGVPGMSYELETVSLITQPEVRDYIRILRDAFWHDPLMEYLFPDESKRRRKLEYFFRANIEFGLTSGEVYGTTSMLGCAVWMFPGDNARARADRLKVPAERLRQVFNGESYQRYLDFEHYVRDVHIRLQYPTYCLLLFLGVEESQRGRGVGHRLMQPVLRYADDKGLPCVLDTMNGDNLPFYRKLGFTVSSEYCICGHGPRTWTMTRRPVL